MRQFSSELFKLTKQESVWIPLGRILTLVASIVAIRVLTELVSPEQYGRLSLITGFISLFSLVIYTSLGKSAVRYIWDFRNQGNSNIWMSIVLLSYIFAGLVFTLALWGGMALGFSYRITNSVAVWTIPVYLVAGNLTTVVLGMMNTLQKHRFFVIGTVIYAWLMPGLAILIVLLVSPTAESILIGYAGSAALMFFGILWLAGTRGLSQFSFSLAGSGFILRKVLRYAVPFMLVSLFYWIQITANRYVLDFKLGAEQVGIFVVASTVARIPIISIESVFGQVHQPVLFQKIGQRNGLDVDAQVRKQAFSDYMTLFLIITLPVLGFTIFGSNLLMRLLVGQEYWTGTTIIPWLALAEFLRAFIATISVAFEVERRPRSLIVPIGAAALVSLSLTYLLSGTQGILGAGIALAVGTLVWLVLIWIPATQLACWHFSWISLLKISGASFSLAGVAWLVGHLAVNFSFFMQSALFTFVFAVGYLLFAGRRLLG